MYVRTLFGGTNHAKLEKKVCFSHFYKFRTGHDGKIKKKHSKMRN